MGNAGTAATQYVQARNNVQFAYRRFGNPTGVPIVLHIHFRGNMDLWDPALVDKMAEAREVILFDNAGVGRSTGNVPTTFAGWARDMISFIEALDLKSVDLLGFSMGGLAVLEAALTAPHLVRKLIIAGSRASVPAVTPPAEIFWPQETSDPKYVTRLVSASSLSEGREALKYTCFPQTPLAEASFDKYWDRLEQRSSEPPQLELLAMDRGGSNQVAALMAAEVPEKGNSFDRLDELKMPVLIMNGDEDALIPTSRSWELLKMIGNAQLIIYPRSGHGFLWQYPNRVAEDVNRFLDGADFE